MNNKTKQMQIYFISSETNRSPKNCTSAKCHVHIVSGLDILNLKRSVVRSDKPHWGWLKIAYDPGLDREKIDHALKRNGIF